MLVRRQRAGLHRKAEITAKLLFELVNARGRCYLGLVPEVGVLQ